jgi:error-prone DNA polymerase
LVKGLREDTGRRISEARGKGFHGISDLARRSRVPRFELARLALCGALSGISGGRREALWEIQALGPMDEEDLFYGIPLDDTPVELRPLTASERITTDYRTVGLSLEMHPLRLLRPQLKRRGALTAEQLAHVKGGRRVGVGGMIICRQRPPTAKGFCFLSLEDETGISNVVIPPALFESVRPAVINSLFVYAEGILERAGKVTNLKARSVVSLALDEAAKDPSTSLRASGLSFLPPD